MDNKFVRNFCIGALVITLISFGLTFFYNNAFMPSFILMLALFLFSVCYYVKDSKKNLMYVLFVLGVLLVIYSLVYTYMRLS